MPGRFYEKLKKQFREAQRNPFMLDKTREQLFPNWKQKKHFFKKNTPFLFFGKCHMSYNNPFEKSHNAEIRKREALKVF